MQVGAQIYASLPKDAPVEDVVTNMLRIQAQLVKFH